MGRLVCRRTHARTHALLSWDCRTAKRPEAPWLFSQRRGPGPGPAGRPTSITMTTGERTTKERSGRLQGGGTARRDERHPSPCVLCRPSAPPFSPESQPSRQDGTVAGRVRNTPLTASVQAWRRASKCGDRGPVPRSRRCAWARARPRRGEARPGRARPGESAPPATIPAATPVPSSLRLCASAVPQRAHRQSHFPGAGDLFVGGRTSVVTLYTRSRLVLCSRCLACPALPLFGLPCHI